MPRRFKKKSIDEPATGAKCDRSGVCQATPPSSSVARSLTQDIDLEGRAFLNNYDYREDPTGALIQGILGAPTVVGQWINSEHYFSATDPEVYGAGSKIYHNVVGRIGIMAGPQSDLRTGLARQSVMESTMPYHEPLRLLVVAEAPRARLIKALENLPHVQALFRQRVDPSRRRRSRGKPALSLRARTRVDEPFVAITEAGIVSPAFRSKPATRQRP